MPRTGRDEERTANKQDAVRDLIVPRKATGREVFGVESAW
jgi:hypothetical protein